MTGAEPSVEMQDFADTSVPVEDRRPAWNVIAILLGFVIVVGVMTVGGGLAEQASFSHVLWAVAIGNIVLAVFAAFAGYVGSKSGKTFNMLLADVFSDNSVRLASLYVPLVLVGWYAIEAAIFGHLLAQAFHLSKTVEIAVIVFGSGLFAVSAYYGFRALRWVSAVLVPLMIVVGVIAIVVASKENAAMFGFGEDSLRLSEAVALVVGTWIMGALTVVPDLTRFSRTDLSGALSGAAALFIGNSFTLLVGAAGAALTRESDPALILISLGLIWVAVLFGVANIWTTNDNNMYSASLHLARVFDTERRTAVLICVSIAALFAAFEPYRLPVLYSWLGFLGNTAPALGAVVLVPAVMPRNSVWEGATSLPAWIGWVGGSAAGFLISDNYYYIIGFVAAVAIYFMAAMLERRVLSVT